MLSTILDMLVIIFGVPSYCEHKCMSISAKSIMLTPFLLLCFLLSGSHFAFVVAGTIVLGVLVFFVFSVVLLVVVFFFLSFFACVCVEIVVISVFPGVFCNFIISSSYLFFFFVLISLSLLL